MWASLVMTPAQIADSGRKMLTMVRVWVPSSGTWSWNWRIVKMAGICYCLLYGMTRGKGKRTWDDHGLATHDEDDLHRPELRHA
jgi:hypothetical protein